MKIDRKIYIDLAKKYGIILLLTKGYSIRAFYFQVTKDIAMHNDAQRDVNTHR